MKSYFSPIALGKKKIFVFQEFQYYMPQCGSLSSSYLESVEFLVVYFHVFHQILEVWGHYFFKYSIFFTGLLKYLCWSSWWYSSDPLACVHCPSIFFLSFFSLSNLYCTIFTFIIFFLFPAPFCLYIPLIFHFSFYVFWTWHFFLVSFWVFILFFFFNIFSLCSSIILTPYLPLVLNIFKSVF